MSSVKIRLQNSSLVGMGTPKSSVKNFEIQNGTCIDRQTISIVFLGNGIKKKRYSMKMILNNVMNRKRLKTLMFIWLNNSSRCLHMKADCTCSHLRTTTNFLQWKQWMYNSKVQEKSISCWSICINQHNKIWFGYGKQNDA